MESELSPENTEKLAQFQELSGIDDLDVCKQILNRHDWNVEVAIHDHLGLESVRNTPFTFHRPMGERNERNGRMPATNSQRRPSNNLPVQGLLARLLHPFMDDQIGSWILPLHSPRGFTGWLLFVTSLPLRIVAVAFFQLTSFVFRLIQPDHRIAITDPVQSFVQTYDQTYGPVHPNFFVGSYNNVLNEAKKELKFLVVYLHCKDHQDTDSFCRQTLSNSDLINYINDNCIMWACNVDTTEGYKVSQCLRENTYPFLALIVQRDYKMTVVGRIEGYHGPEQTLQRMQTIIADNEAFLVAARADRQERSFTQALRQEQDQAYEESLRADREKEERKRREKLLEEERLKEQREAEEAEKRRQQELIQRKVDAVNHVPEEPSSQEPGLCRILVRLPNGQKLERRFRRSEHTLKDLYYFILAHPDSPHHFEMATSFPKRTLPYQEGQDTCPTLADAGLGASEALLVLDLDA